MKRTWLNVLLAASLCLNGGFIAAVVVHHARHSLAHPQPDLKLSPPVKAQFDASETAFWDKMGLLHEELQGERAKMLDVLASQGPSPEAVKAQQEKVLGINARILQAVTDHVLDVKRLFSPDEQRRFFEFIQRRNHETARRPQNPNEEKRP